MNAISVRCLLLGSISGEIISIAHARTGSVKRMNVADRYRLLGD